MNEQRATQWRQFYEQDGGLRDMLAAMRSDCAERMLEVDDVEKMRNLSITAKLVDILDAQVRAVFAGEVTLAQRKEFAKRIEGLSPAKRRWI